MSSVISRLTSTISQNKGKVVLAASVTGATVLSATSPDDGFWPALFDKAFTIFAQEGGWPAFGMLALIIVIGAFAEWWVPGRRYRRVEESAAAQSETLDKTVTLLKDQTMANEITKDFFLKTIPKRGEHQE